jgi:hypothetical protein
MMAQQCRFSKTERLNRKWFSIGAYLSIRNV